MRSGIPTPRNGAGQVRAQAEDVRVVVGAAELRAQLVLVLATLTAGIAVLSCFLLLTPTSARPGGTLQYNRDIRPILTKNCTACHGGVKAAGGISFIYREKALGTGKSGHYTAV